MTHIREAETTIEYFLISSMRFENIRPSCSIYYIYSESPSVVPGKKTSRRKEFNQIQEVTIVSLTWYSP